MKIQILKKERKERSKQEKYGNKEGKKKIKRKVDVHAWVIPRLYMPTWGPPLFHVWNAIKRIQISGNYLERKWAHARRFSSNEEF